MNNAIIFLEQFIHVLLLIFGSIILIIFILCALAVFIYGILDTLGII